MMVLHRHKVPPPKRSIESSAIRDAAYDERKRELRITFVSGRRYAYANVPQSIYDAFLASPSRGTFFNIAIRGRYQFREMLTAGEAAF